MNDYLSFVLGIIVTPLAYLIGYKSRYLVPLNRRFFVGFTVAFTILTIAFVLSLAFKGFSGLTQSIAMAFAIGFPLGIAGPPFNNPTRKG